MEGLIVALREKAPRAAILLLSPMLQSCTRGLKIPRWKPYHKIPTDEAGSREVLTLCFQNNTIAAVMQQCIAGRHGHAARLQPPLGNSWAGTFPAMARTQAFEDLGQAHGLSVVSIRSMLRQRLWASPADASHIVGKRVADAVHPTGFGHWEYALAIEYAIGVPAGYPRGVRPLGGPPGLAPLFALRRAVRLAAACHEPLLDPPQT